MTTELQRSRIGVRMMSALLALDLAKNFISPALWILGESKSVIGTVATLATWPWALGVIFVAAAAMAAPYIVMHLFLPNYSHQVECTQWACRGMLIGGVIWIYMAYLSRNLDYEVATGVFLFNGVFSIAMAAILGYGINLEQLEKEACV